ncbi:MAG: hypothetical protein ACTIL2_14920 [Corynebacterium sp.]|uniref:hypothetical protein n=1 Tax=Corynebacterium sp. TaxID=1720 RepID=UPI003F95FCEE
MMPAVQSVLPEAWSGLFPEPSVNHLLPLAEADARVLAASRAVGAEVIEVGQSRQGRPITLHRFGTSPVRSLWYGGPHANEAVGVSTIVTLAEALAAQPGYLDKCGFDLITCIDPDAHALNEHWFPGFDGDPATYFSQMYRPPMDEFVDWDMPVEITNSHGTFRREPRHPEGRALFAALELSRPAVVMALHNAEIGGMYYHQIGGTPELASALSRIPAEFGIPAEPTPIDAPDAAPLAPGVFPLPGVTDMFGPLIDATPDDPTSVLTMGESAMTWSLGYGAVSIVPEIPFWSPVEPRPKQDATLADVAGASAQRLAASADTLSGLCTRYADSLPESNARARSVRDAVGMLRGLSALLTSLGDGPHGTQPATPEDVRRWGIMLGLSTPQRYVGMLLNALEDAAPENAAPGDAVDEVRDLFDTNTDLLNRYSYRFHGIGTLVDIQLATGFTAIDSLTEGRPQ